MPRGSVIREASDLAGLSVRQAVTGDRAALEVMFGRCSRKTVYQRFHGHMAAIPAAYLAEALAGVPEHFALVVADGPGVVALASCREGEPGGAVGDAPAAAAASGDAPAAASSDAPAAASGDAPAAASGDAPAAASGDAPAAASSDAPAGAELGILVEDGWQRCGLGGLLLRRLIEHADSRGLSILHAQVLEEQAWLERLLGAFGKCSSAFRSGTREIVLKRERMG